MSKYVNTVIFPALIIFFLLLTHTLSAKTTTYSDISSVNSRSKLLKYIFTNYKVLAPHFIHYKNFYIFSTNEKNLSFLKKTVSAAYKSVSQDLYLSPLKRDYIKITVISMGSKLWRKTGMPFDSAAFYLPDTNEIYIKIDSDIQVLKETISHELTHLVLGNTEKNIPLWFHEGMAQYEACKINGKFPKLPGLKDLDLEKLEKSKYAVYNGSKKLFYLYSLAVIKKIADTGDLSLFSKYYIHKNSGLKTSLKEAVSPTVTINKFLSE